MSEEAVKTEETVKQETPVSDKPVTDKPVTDKPVTDKPVTDKPKSDQKPPVLGERRLQLGQGTRPPGGGGGGGDRGPRGPRPEGGNRGPERGGGGDRGGGNDRAPRPSGGGGLDRGPRFNDFSPDIDLEKLIADSLYLDNQAHAVVARLRDMDSGTKSQLRRFYNAVRRACRTVETERQHEFVMLRARLAYTIARHGLRSLDVLERLLLQVTRKNDQRGYERFRDLFEAIVAYNE